MTTISKTKEILLTIVNVYLAFNMLIGLLVTTAWLFVILLSSQQEPMTEAVCSGAKAEILACAEETFPSQNQKNEP